MGTKGQVTLPKRVREALGLRAGDLLETVLTPEGALTRPVELKPKKVDALEEALAEAEADVKAGRSASPTSRRMRWSAMPSLRAGASTGVQARRTSGL